MERIKQALDKARNEQKAGQERTDRAQAPQAVGSTVLAESEIKYSNTQVHELDPNVLSANHVLIGDGSRDALTAYKMLRTQILQRMVSRQWNALGISSPNPGEGKTLTAVNLAISLARELHHTVLLVDLDLRNPSVHRKLGLTPSHGIDDYLLHGVPLEKILVNPGIERLVILPARTSVSNSSEILASPAMGRLVQELKSRYPMRLVLFDLPPILSADDTLAFGPHMDALLLVLRDGQTKRDEIERTLEILKDVPIVGTVLNDSSDKTATYY